MATNGIHDFPPKSGQIFDGFQLEDCLKSSSNCVVHVCHHIKDISLKFVAKIGIKREATKLVNELKYYQDLEGGDGIPQLIHHKRWIESTEEWIEIDWSLIVIEKLCPRFKKTTTRFLEESAIISLQELIPMAVQQINILEFVHNRGLLHKGIKPDNFVMSDDGSKVYLIDFNRSKRYLRSGNHVEFQRDLKIPKGLPLFHSVNYHNGLKCSRRDDMEALGYCWVYFLKGSLPWSSVERERRVKHWSDYVQEVGVMKANTSPQELCSGLPEGFTKYFEVCRSLQFFEKPNYEELRQLIANSISDSNNNQ